MLTELRKTFQGEILDDLKIRSIYATDASAYRELPLAVVYPKDEADIQILVRFAGRHKVGLIPRTAGTSLAGQVVGDGIVVDVSRHFTKIIEVNEAENWVRVQPGVIRDELNMFLEPSDLFFGPETSTANRAMIGGMIGNNSSGSNSIVYRTMRENLISVRGVMSNGSIVEFGEKTAEEFIQKTKDETLEGRVYHSINKILSDSETRQNITREFPKPSIFRRNTGYAIDLLMDSDPFLQNKKPFNFCKIIAGSEGTLLFVTEAKLKVNPMPPAAIGLVCAHFTTIYDCLRANLIALKYKPSASEVMDNYILDCTKGNIGQRPNRFFVQGDPKAILVIEIRKDTLEEAMKIVNEMVEELKKEGLGYHHPIITGADTSKVWELRKAGLGLLSNMPGDAKPVPVVEDTAVDVNDLPEYIKEFDETMEKQGLPCVHYAHASAGELHLRPILNLKTEKDTKLFRKVLEDVSSLVKKYRGSLSGEHGDGRLRGEFIPFMIGEKNYEVLKQIKEVFDPENIFNPGKIVDTPPMDKKLRFFPGQQTREFDTKLNFDSTHGYLRAAEQCNGAGDCRKTELTGGVMCPSYMATRDEKDTTRARANILREILTNSEKKNPFDSKEIREVLDLCLSCKGCKSECPSNVDMAKLKAEFEYQYYKSNKPSARTRRISSFKNQMELATRFRVLYNLLLASKFPGRIIRNLLGIHPNRSMPKLSGTFRKKFRQTEQGLANEAKRKVYFFCDEFTNYHDPEIGIAAVTLLTRLGYEVVLANLTESGRSYISKGFLDEARKIAIENVSKASEFVNPENPLIGIEPSAILSFRDEYIDLAEGDTREKAISLSENCLLLEEFLSREIDAGKITSKQFTDKAETVKVHAHCHQKSLSSLTHLKKALSVPKNYQVHFLRTGCCGMAGSFGYEKEHYDLSMKIGNLVLFPALKKLTSEIVAAPGTSCRHQIKDGTGMKALHPAEILLKALR
jgi:FAD/FMN-containing dehydrogenase/Fe-S oxidoreductase